MPTKFSVGDRVVVHGRELGTVRYVGSVHYAKGDDWCGVELDDPGYGKNDGTVKGRAYFKCAAKMGLLVKASGVEPADGTATPKPRRSSRRRGRPAPSAPSLDDDEALLQMLLEDMRESGASDSDLAMLREQVAETGGVRAMLQSMGMGDALEGFAAPPVAASAPPPSVRGAAARSTVVEAEPEVVQPRPQRSKLRLKRPPAKPLHEAAKRGDLAEVTSLLSSAQGAAGLNELDTISMSALGWACRNGHLDVARALIDAGAQAAGVGDEDETLPLLAAAAANQAGLSLSPY